MLSIEWLLRNAASRLFILGFAAGLTLVVAASGCSGDSGTAPVIGKVMYKGAALTNQTGVVQLIPEGNGNAATGELAPDGSFKLTTFKADDGAVPGKYKVAVRVYPPADAGGAGLPGREFGGKEPPIPNKYSDVATSGLTAEIKSGENKLDLDLK